MAWPALPASALLCTSPACCRSGSDPVFFIPGSPCLCRNNVNGVSGERAPQAASRLGWEPALPMSASLMQYFGGKQISQQSLLRTP